MSSASIGPSTEEYQLREADLLGRTLVRLGLVAQRRVREAQQAVHAHGAGATTFGRQLVRWGYLPQDELARAETLVRRNLWICPRCLEIGKISEQAAGVSFCCNGCGGRHQLRGSEAPNPPEAAPRAANDTTCDRNVQFGRYRIIQRLGRGATDVAHRAVDTRTGREVALRIHQIRGDDSGARTATFLAEAQMLVRLSHPNIIPAHAIGRVGTRLYCTTELLQGAPLRQRIDQGVTGTAAACRIGIGLADALGYLHGQGFVHRDVSPRNVLLDGWGEPVLIGFGLAQPLAGGGPTADPVLGTPAYLPPEHARFAVRRTRDTRPAADPRSDVYSLGATLYHLMTGRAPFVVKPGEGLRALLTQIIEDPPEPPSAIHADICPDTEAMLLQALARQPAERYPTAHALRDELRRILAIEPMRRPHPPETKRFWKLVLGRQTSEMP